MARPILLLPLVLILIYLDTSSSDILDVIATTAHHILEHTIYSPHHGHHDHDHHHLRHDHGLGHGLHHHHHPHRHSHRHKHRRHRHHHRSDEDFDSSEECETDHFSDLKHVISGHDIKFPCASTKNIFTGSGRYEAKNVIATRMQVGSEYAYLALPRLKHGVPVTLSRIKLRKPDTGISELEPFPCWSLQEEGNCEAMQSVVDLALDCREILWVLDSGIVNTLEQPIMRCPPKILGICIKSTRVLKRIDLSDVITGDSRLQHILVDYDAYGNCYVYVSDAGAGAILVHDSKLNQNYRVVLPDACVPSKRDIMYMVLVRREHDTPFVYFTYLHSNRLFYIRSEHLRKGLGSGSVVDVAKKPKDALILLGSDNGCGVFLRFRGDGDIYRWDADSCFDEDHLQLVQDAGCCRLSTQVAPGVRDFMWTIESNFQDFVNNECGNYGPSVAIRPLLGDSDD